MDPDPEDTTIRWVKGPFFLRTFKRSWRRRGLKRVKAKITYHAEGCLVACTECGHAVQCTGLSRRQVRGACAMLRSTCPQSQDNHYVPMDGHQ